MNSMGFGYLPGPNSAMLLIRASEPGYKVTMRLILHRSI